MNEGDRLVTLLTAVSEHEANILAIVLRDRGIDAVVFGTSYVMGSNVLPGLGVAGAPVQVPASQVSAAREILASNRRDSVDIDWDELGLPADDEPEADVGKMPLAAKVAACVVALWLLIILMQFVATLIS